MALNVLPQAPTITGVYQVRDFVPQLTDASKSAASALQNAFKFRYTGSRLCYSA